MMRAGVILAGGRGTRLAPLTSAINKHLLLIHDRPMICYPLATLMSAGIRDLLLITTPEDRPRFSELLADGSQWGIHLEYAEQPEPRGVAEALVIARDFIARRRVALILGDNIFHGERLIARLRRALAHDVGATVFAKPVPDPERYGLVELDGAGRPLRLEEKPAFPRSRYAVTGLYCYDEHASAIASTLAPSARGELEITDLNADYLRRGELYVDVMGPDVTWFDAGTHETLRAASRCMQAVESAQGRALPLPAEIGWRQGWLTYPPCRTSRISSA